MFNNATSVKTIEKRIIGMFRGGVSVVDVRIPLNCIQNTSFVNRKSTERPSIDKPLVISKREGYVIDGHTYDTRFCNVDGCNVQCM